MRDAKGQLIGVLGIARDVTQLRQNELRMQRLNQLYRVLMDVSEVVTKPLSLLAMYRAICDIVVRESGVQAVVVWEPNAASDQLLSVCAAGRGLELDQAWTLTLSEPDDYLSISSQEVFRTGVHIIWRFKLSTAVSCQGSRRALTFGRLRCCL